jgi:hypothetical protein
VFAPIKTDPIEIAFRNDINSLLILSLPPQRRICLTRLSGIWSFPRADLKKMRYVGALSKKEESPPDIQ